MTTPTNKLLGNTVRQASATIDIVATAAEAQPAGAVGLLRKPSIDANIPNPTVHHNLLPPPNIPVKSVEELVKTLVDESIENAIDNVEEEDLRRRLLALEGDSTSEIRLTEKKLVLGATQKSDLEEWLADDTDTISERLLADNRKERILSELTEGQPVIEWEILGSDKGAKSAASPESLVQAEVVSKPKQMVVQAETPAPADKPIATVSIEATPKKDSWTVQLLKDKTTNLLDKIANVVRSAFRALADRIRSLFKREKQVEIELGNLGKRTTLIPTDGLKDTSQPSIEIEPATPPATAPSKAAQVKSAARSHEASQTLFSDNKGSFFFKAARSKKAQEEILEKLVIDEAEKGRKDYLNPKTLRARILSKLGAIRELDAAWKKKNPFKFPSLCGAEGFIPKFEERCKQEGQKLAQFAAPKPVHDKLRIVESADNILAAVENLQKTLNAALPTTYASNSTLDANGKLQDPQVLKANEHGFKIILDKALAPNEEISLRDSFIASLNRDLRADVVSKSYGEAARKALRKTEKAVRLGIVDPSFERDVRETLAEQLSLPAISRRFVQDRINKKDLVASAIDCLRSIYTAADLGLISPAVRAEFIQKLNLPAVLRTDISERFESESRLVGRALATKQALERIKQAEHAGLVDSASFKEEAREFYSGVIAEDLFYALVSWLTQGHDKKKGFFAEHAGSLLNQFMKQSGLDALENKDEIRTEIQDRIFNVLVQYTTEEMQREGNKGVDSLNNKANALVRLGLLSKTPDFTQAVGAKLKEISDHAQSQFRQTVSEAARKVVLGRRVIRKMYRVPFVKKTIEENFHQQMDLLVRARKVKQGPGEVLAKERDYKATKAEANRNWEEYLAYNQARQDIIGSLPDLQKHVQSQINIRNAAYDGLFLQDKPRVPPRLPRSLRNKAKNKIRTLQAPSAPQKIESQVEAERRTHSEKVAEVVARKHRSRSEDFSLASMESLRVPKAVPVPVAVSEETPKSLVPAEQPLRVDTTTEYSWEDLRGLMEPLSGDPESPSKQAFALSVIGEEAAAAEEPLSPLNADELAALN